MVLSRLVNYISTRLRAMALAGSCGMGMICLSASGCVWYHADECATDACRAPKYHAHGGYSHYWDIRTTRYTAERCAREALGQCGDVDDDFRDGYIQAYVDLAFGGNGELPAIPPEPYWQAHYRSAAGHQAAGRWFEGYSAGTESARGRGIDQYTDVASNYVRPAEPQDMHSVSAALFQPDIHAGPPVHAGLPMPVGPPGFAGPPVQMTPPTHGIPHHTGIPSTGSFPPAVGYGPASPQPLVTPAPGGFAQPGPPGRYGPPLQPPMPVPNGFR